ncbi:MAG: hypothetical protein JNN32_06920 [Flavobacteriales bacterium]|nr:hypothetical protein [Flavobacteriales bacterium]
MKADDPNGNVFVFADFGKGVIKDQFHAIMVAEEKMTLRDDGLGGDSIPGDGVFTVALQEDRLATEQLLEKTSESTNKALAAQPVFVGRERVDAQGQLKGMRPFDKDLFNKGGRVRIPFPTLCTPVSDVSIPHSIMVTDLGVVEDVDRTSQPCTRPNGTGAWTFGKLMSDMANEAASGVAPQDFVKNWLRQWMEPQTVNSDAVPARTRIFTDVIRPWVIASGAAPGSFDENDWESKDLDLAKAPFKLTAIVNRLDLRGNTGYSVTNAGEGRFVFEVLSSTCSPTAFTVIFEYGIPINKCGTLVGYARKWYDLRTLTLGSPEYNTALQAITDVFAAANADPTKPNGSAINQIRTNEIALGSPWELREFHVDATSHHLIQAPVVNEPAKKFNARANPAGNAADVTVLANWVNTVFPSNSTVPLTFNGAPFLGGKSHTEFNGIWNAAPGQITDPANRHLFSLGTCSGCHGGETGTTFLHVGTPAFGTEAPLSRFLTGFTMNDPVSNTPHTFGDLERRQQDLARLLCACTGRRLPDMVQVLTFKPINMPH